MKRRQFIGTSAAAAVSAFESQGRDAVEEAATKVGRLPRRRLGGGNREISMLVGAGTWSREAIEAGIRCGVNFWHKADNWWSGSTPPAIAKNREAHFCTVCVDRVRGNHETGQIDEEAHYRFVKQAVATSGLRYFDDMQFHFGYHNVAELKNNRAFVRAYQRLRKEGLVKHLCLSQHSYNGNSRVRGGQSAPEILTAVIEDGVFEHAQFIYSYGDGGEINSVITLAKKKGFGTVGMKTTRGAWRMSQDPAFMKNLPAGTTPHHALARWLTTRTGLDAAVIQINSLEEFADTFSGAGKTMRSSDHRAIFEMAAYADREVCRLCNECLAHCPAQIPISDILRYERYAVDYREPARAHRLYADLDRHAGACTACGECLPHCPQGLRIPEKLAGAHSLLSAVL